MSHPSLSISKFQVLPSGNQTWTWTIPAFQMILPLRPVFIQEFPVPCLIERGQTPIFLVRPQTQKSNFLQLEHLRSLLLFLRCPLLFRFFCPNHFLIFFRFHLKILKQHNHVCHNENKVYGLWSSIIIQESHYLWTINPSFDDGTLGYNLRNKQGKQAQSFYFQSTSQMVKQ